jgi:hypothetical protein
MPFLVVKVGDQGFLKIPTPSDVTVEVEEEESGNIENWEERKQAEVFFLPKITRRVCNNYEEKYLAEDLGFWIVDHWEIPGVVVQHPDRTLVRVNDFREVPHRESKEGKEKEQEGGIPETKNIRSSEADIQRESLYESISLNLIEQWRESTTSEVMFIAHAVSREMKKEEQSKDAKVGVTEEKSEQNSALKKSNPNFKTQLLRMVVVTGKLTKLNNDYNIVAKPGWMVIKTWRVLNNSDYEWPNDVFIKSVSNDIDCELPTISRRLQPKEEMEISVRFQIPEKATDNVILNYIFSVWSREFGHMGDLFGRSLLRNNFIIFSNCSS